MTRDVTIVIPVKDREDLIVRCLESVASQTLMPSRVIVVDNGSTDHTVNRVREWSETHPTLNLELTVEQKPGASAARNRGLRMVDTEYVLFFDSDDEMLPTLLEKAFEAIGDSDLVYWKGKVKGLDGKTYLKPFYADSLMRRQFYNAILSSQLFMARTSLIREVGCWEEKAMVWNDWELGIRIAMSRPKWRALPETLVIIHAQKQSITGSAFSHRTGDWENTLDIVERDICSSELGSHEKKRLLDMLAYRRVVLAALYRREGAADKGLMLLKNALDAPNLNRRKRMLLKIIYHYTSAGGRAAYYLWR